MLRDWKGPTDSVTTPPDRMALDKMDMAATLPITNRLGKVLDIGHRRGNETLAILAD